MSKRSIIDSRVRSHYEVFPFPQQKREAVAEAAFELFLKEGFHRTTTRDIAHRAGVSAGAPFPYFKDKEDIL